MTHGMQAGHILPGKQALFLTLMLQRIHSLQGFLHIYFHIFPLYNMESFNLSA